MSDWIAGLLGHQGQDAFLHRIASLCAGDACRRSWWWSCCRRVVWVAAAAAPTASDHWTICAVERLPGLLHLRERAMHYFQVRGDARDPRQPRFQAAVSAMR